MNQTEIDELRRLHAEATPGKWTPNYTQSGIMAGDEYVACEGYDLNGSGGILEQQDLDLIVAARRDPLGGLWYTAARSAHQRSSCSSASLRPPPRRAGGGQGRAGQGEWVGQAHGARQPGNRSGVGLHMGRIGKPRARVQGGQPVSAAAVSGRRGAP